MKLFILSLIFVMSFSAYSNVEFGYYERNSANDFVSYCPLNVPGKIICTEKAPNGKSNQFSIGSIFEETVNSISQKINLIPEEQLIRLDARYRQKVKQSVLHGYYVKIKQDYYIISIAHDYTSLHIILSDEMYDAIVALDQIEPLFYKFTATQKVLASKKNICPDLRGQYKCTDGTDLSISQTSLLADEYYQFNYYNRGLFDFGASEVGVRNGNRTATCSKTAVTMGTIYELDENKNLSVNNIKNYCQRIK